MQRCCSPHDEGVLAVSSTLSGRQLRKPDDHTCWGSETVPPTDDEQQNADADKKNQDFSSTFQDPMKNFWGPFRSQRMFKYKEKTAFTYNIHRAVHCRKFTMKQNVLHYRCLFSIWILKHWKKCMTFKDIFPGLSRTLSINFQDFPGLSRTKVIFQVLEFSRTKKSGISKTFQEAWEPSKICTLDTVPP